MVLFALFIAGLLMWSNFNHFISTPASKSKRLVTVTIPEGSSFRNVARALRDKGVISDDFRFTIMARVLGLTRSVQAGDYEFNLAMTPRQVLDDLVHGRVRLITVTIPEGFTMVDVANRLERLEITSAEGFLELARNPDTARSLTISGDTLEGYLFPDTYKFKKASPPERVIRTMVRRWENAMAPFEEQIGENELSVNEIMTLASIVEKETSVKEEKPLVAAVFINRLKRNMRLAADPTVIYGISDFDGNLTKNHLTTDTPYNTYTRAGLPPGPIANPGLDSILAVLNPADTEYLFFVSRNDGTHAFSTNYKTHREAVRKYQQKK